MFFSWLSGRLIDLYGYTLLDDPGGPLYDRDRAGELESDLRNALRALDG